MTEDKPPRDPAERRRVYLEQMIHAELLAAVRDGKFDAILNRTNQKGKH